MKSFVEKTIAFTLVFVMVFNVSSASLAAGVKIAKERKTEAPIIEQDTDEEEVEIIGEQKEKRKLNEKHFILSNGSELAAVYPENVHYEQDGEMKDIDNSLEEKTLGDESVYQNKYNSYKVNFAKETKENNKLVTLNSNGYEINWILDSTKKESMGIQEDEIVEKKEDSKQLLNEKNKEKEQFIRQPKTVEEKINKVEAKILKKEEKNNQKVDKKNEKIEEKAKLENVTSNIKYENILDKIDLEYEVKAENVKESIIINDKSGLQKEFIFRFNTGGLKAELLENKEIVIYKDNKDEYIFKIESPYMFDNNCEYSSEIEVKLEQDKDTNEYILTIIPNKEWLKSKERVYPITIDPTIKTSRYYQDIKDTFIFDGDASSDTRHRSHIIRVGNNNRTGTHKNPTRGLIKFTIPELCAGDQVIRANLNICNYPDTSEWTPPGREIQLDVHRMTSDWAEESASWESLSNSYNYKVEDYEKYQFDYNNQCKFYTFNITGIVKDWYTTGNNYGLMLKEHYETYNLQDSDAYFISANTNVAYYEGRPFVIIEYRNQTGIEDYLSYHTQNIGRAGTVYTNDYNGNLVLLHPDVATPGNKLPIAINHVFNTNDKDRDIGYGRGYRLNLSQTIEFQTIDSIEYAKYIDEDGTAHYFKKEGTNYKDEDGLNLTLYRDSSTCTIEDKSGNKSIFTIASNGRQIWYLTKVIDTEENSINITIGYNSSGAGIVTKVVDGANQAINLTYSGDHLETITDLNGRVTKYFYTDSKLTQIQYSDSKSSIYTYSWDNKLISAKNIDGIRIDYEYYQEKTSRVKKIQEYSSNNEAGNSLQIQYGHNTTIFTDENGYSNTTVFNNFGNATSIADFGKENNVNGAYGKTYSYGTSGGNKNKLTLESKLISIKEMPNNLVQNPYFDNGLNGWTTYDCQSYDLIENTNNNNVFKFIGESSRYKYLRQNVNVSGKKGDIFNASTWVKTYGVPSEDTVRGARLNVNIIGTDGNDSHWELLPANNDSSSWQLVSNQFVTRYDYSRIDIYLMCYENENATYFDNIGLFKEDFGQSYTYDSKGNLVSTQNEAKKNSEFTYNGRGGLLSSINPKGGRYSYEYDFNHKNRLLKAINTTGIMYSFNYDSNGNTTSAKVSERRKSDKIENNKEYYIKTASSDKYFDIPGMSTNNGVKLQQWEQIGATNQKFILEDVGEGYYKIHPVHSKTKLLAVDASDNSIQQWEAVNNISSSYWKFIENDDGTYRIVNKYLRRKRLYCIKR